MNNGKLIIAETEEEFIHRQYELEQMAIVRRWTIMKHMNSTVMLANDEYLIERWLYTVPDRATEEDLWEIAEVEEDFEDVRKLFIEIFSNKYFM